MASRRNRHAPVDERDKREEREQRILDAASELIQRWGYNKTTIEDIAKHAGVAKGTIYLHWKTRDELFWTLIRREELRMTVDIQARLAADPDGITLPGLLKHSMLASLKNPLMKAVLMNDQEVLGALAQQEYRSVYYQQTMSSYRMLFEFMRERGIIRNDLSIEEEIYMLSAISWGFLVVDPLMPDELRFSDERIVEMMADALERSLAPAVPPTPEEKRRASEEYAEYVKQLMQIASQEYIQKKEDRE